MGRGRGAGRSFVSVCRGMAVGPDPCGARVRMRAGGRDRGQRRRHRRMGRGRPAHPVQGDDPPDEGA
ncbi:hypothetical protein AB5I41_05035 [Sphingomonas sp. MMS24-JH45]